MKSKIRKFLCIGMIAVSCSIMYFAWNWWGYWPLLRLRVINGAADG